MPSVTCRTSSTTFHFVLVNNQSLQHFGDYHASQLMLIRHTLLAYFQDTHKKVS